MHQEIAIVAIAAFLWGTVFVGATRHIAVSGPIVFAAIGVITGQAVLGIANFGDKGGNLLTMAQYALALILFADAAKTDFACLRGNAKIPERLLGIALPLSIGLGAVTAVVLFPSLTFIEALLLAALIAPTDAALGQPVVESKAVPAPLREGLKFESGLNDGLVAPLVLILIAVAAGEEHGRAFAITLTVEGLGIGLMVGGAVGYGAAMLTRLSQTLGWRRRGWTYAAAVMLAFAAFGLTDTLGGAGFIGAFIAGLAFGFGHGASPSDLTQTGEIGTLFSLVTWLVFGAALIGPLGHAITWQSFAFAALSLTVVRMVPVAIAFIGSGLSLREQFFLGWFGPRGLASIVFVLIVASSDLAGEDTILAAASCTVAASVIAHGVTAHFVSYFVPKHRKQGTDAVRRRI